MGSRILKIDHVGIAVPDLEVAIAQYTQLFGTGPQSIEDVPDQKVRTAFFVAGETNLELLCPTAPDSPVGRFLARRGAGVHHICLEVPNIESALQACRDADMQFVDAEPRSGAHGKRIAFLHPHAMGGVLFELSESTAASCGQHRHTPHATGGGTPGEAG